MFQICSISHIAFLHSRSYWWTDMLSLHFLTSLPITFSFMEPSRMVKVFSFWTSHTGCFKSRNVSVRKLNCIIFSIIPHTTFAEGQTPHRSLCYKIYSTAMFVSLLGSNHIAVDTFSFSQKGMLAYIFSPTFCIPKIIVRLMQSLGTTSILIVPIQWRKAYLNILLESCGNFRSACICLLSGHTK